MVTIYKMLDPDTKQIRYIGKTTQTMTARLRGHLSSKQSGHSPDMRRWLNGLVAAGKEPIMEQVAVVEDKDSKAMELGLIFFYTMTLRVSLFNRYKFPGPIAVNRLETYKPKTEAEAVKAILTEAPIQKDEVITDDLRALCRQFFGAGN
jgi:hypothetical protein